MSTATLPREARRNVVLFSSPGAYAKKDGTNEPDPTAGFTKSRETLEDGREVLVIKNMPVFRSGTFRDSMGIQHTWDDVHIDYMVQNFGLLRERGVLEHVPVRRGHPSFFASGGQITDEIVGWHDALHSARMTNPADGKEYNYLLADYTILDPNAIVKADAGLWRNMSAEVGSWFTNDEAEYWPVYAGVAYVDFSAVEGLKNYASANGVGSKYSVMSEQEQNVPEGQNPQGQVQVPTPPANVPLPPAPQAQVQSQHAASGPVTHVFTIGGQQTSDFAAVQAHIAQVEQQNAQFSQMFTEQREAGRKAFCKSLAEGPAPKIKVAQLDDTEKFALSLTDEQFALWKGQWDAAPGDPSLANHGATGTGTQQVNPPQGSPAATAADELEVAKAIVEQFRSTNMSVEAIKLTPSYRKLEAANQAPAL